MPDFSSETRPSDLCIIDAHVHFFPDKLFAAIWSYWQRVYVPLFPNWHNRYQWRQSERIDFLDQQGIKAYTVLNYAHKPGVAQSMNDWTHELCRKLPKAIPLGTVHPGDPGFMHYAEKALTQYAFKGLKLQHMVTDFYLHDPRLDPLHRLLRDLDKVLVVHAGTAPGINQRPFPGAKVGAEHFMRYLDKFPDNKVVVAHMGGYEYETFFQLVAQTPNLFLDTAMVWIPPEAELFPEEDRPENILGRQRVIDFLESYSHRILFGSDFPNIPFSYAKSVTELLKLNLSHTAFDAIFHGNAHRVFKLPLPKSA